ncbi:MAG TPA: YhjD/YihY/BrkB family envelope integrity protein, partial [Candidatus Baltobacteraceae bacterium]|nr:YhjD/YihY/BrkB family envelope integrity protein [Candidatus Baltobacteraceae bacterium]
MRKYLASIVKIWGRHRVSRVAAALAFYAIFALAPVTFLVLLVARTVAGPERVLKVIDGELGPLIGNKGTQGVDQLVRGSQHQAHTLPLALAAFLFIIAAIAILMQVQEALDDVWGITEGKRGGLKGVLRLRLHVLLIVLATGLLAVVALFTGIMLGRAAGFGVNLA